MNTNVTDKLKLKYSENKDIVSSVSKWKEAVCGISYLDKCPSRIVE